MKDEPTHGQKMKAIRKRANWLKFCLEIGWTKDQVDGLERIWDENHDEFGNLIAPTEQKDIISRMVSNASIVHDRLEPTAFETALKSELDKLPSDGQYNDGQLAGFEKGAIWANQRMQIEVYYLENEKDGLIQENKRLREQISINKHGGIPE